MYQSINLVLNGYSLFLVALLGAYTRQQSNRKNLSDRLFLWIIYTVLLLLGADMLSRFEGRPNSLYPLLNQTGNFLLFFLSLILPSLWLLYVHGQIHKVSPKTKSTRKLILPLMVLNGLNALFVIASLAFGWYYQIDKENHYTRGPLFLLPALVAIVLIAISFYLLVTHAKTLERKTLYSLLLPSILPLLCILIQVWFYGLSLVLNGVAISLILVFMNFQNHHLNTDYMTGIHNRKTLEKYLKRKVNNLSKEGRFAAILLDLDNFKGINDNFGHGAGDEALESAARIFKSCLRERDFLARYGGDEFYIVVNTERKEVLLSIMERITKAIEVYNQTRENSYTLGVSMGYGFYHHKGYANLEAFQLEVDRRMYVAKEQKKRTNQILKLNLEDYQC